MLFFLNQWLTLIIILAKSCISNICHGSVNTLLQIQGNGLYSLAGNEYTSLVEVKQRSCFFTKLKIGFKIFTIIWIKPNSFVEQSGAIVPLSFSLEWDFHALYSLVICNLPQGSLKFHHVMETNDFTHWSFIWNSAISVTQHFYSTKKLSFWGESVRLFPLIVQEY